jgi:hypothetical protein
VARFCKVIATDNGLVVAAYRIGIAETRHAIPKHDSYRATATEKCGKRDKDWQHNKRHSHYSFVPLLALAVPLAATKSLDDQCQRISFLKA